jgi:hypothetical protein
MVVKVRVESLGLRKPAAAFRETALLSAAVAAGCVTESYSRL